MMNYFALHRWSKFKINLTTFQGVISKKPPRSSLNWYFLLVRKHLKFENSGTKNETYMKLGPVMYLLNTFHIPKHEGVNEWVGRRRIQKTTKKYHEINKISTLTTHNNSLQNTMKVGFFLM